MLQTVLLKQNVIFYTFIEILMNYNTRISVSETINIPFYIYIRVKYWIHYSPSFVSFLNYAPTR